jgi:hypothetical protein
MDVQDSSTYSANSPQKTTIRRIIHRKTSGSADSPCCPRTFSMLSLALIFWMCICVATRRSSIGHKGGAGPWAPELLF